MRLVELSLENYGAFSARTLSFPTAPGIVKLIYGPNEAGKSTCLRAVEAWLFGFPPRTKDGHDKRARLRVGGTLEKEDGSRLTFARRSGRGQTVLTADDQPLGDDVPRAFLGGVDAEMFRALYGLDGQRLRSGADALLGARGGLGERRAWPAPAPAASLVR